MSFYGGPLGDVVHPSHVLFVLSFVALSSLDLGYCEDDSKVEVGLLIVIWLGWLVCSIFTCYCGVELVVEAVVVGVGVGFVVKVGLVGG